MFTQLPLELQREIATYLATPDLCFFALTSKRNLQTVLPLLIQRQQTLLCPPQVGLLGKCYLAMITMAHTVYACGDNRFGQLGLGDKHDRSTFTQVSNLPGTIQQLAAGGSHTLVLTSQGLYACGYNDYGQLGL